MKFKFFNEVWVPAPSGRSIVREQLLLRHELPRLDRSQRQPTQTALGA
jgi:hypothetical protein